MKSTTELKFRKKVLSALEEVFDDWQERGFIQFFFYGGNVFYNNTHVPTFFVFNDGKVKGIYSADSLLFRKLESLGLSLWYRLERHQIWSYGKMIRVIEANNIHHWLPRMLDLSKIKDENLKARFMKISKGNYTKENRTLAYRGVIETTQKRIKYRSLHDIQYY